MILCVAGTSDARMLAVEIKRSGYQVLTTVVTENASIELKKQGLDVHVGRLTDQQFISLINQYEIEAIVDASHPFAEEASKNAIQAAQQTNIPYIRYERETGTYTEEQVTIVSSYEEAAEIAADRKGVILLTTGSKTLPIFTEKLLGLPNTRMIARMLPRKDNMEKCEQLGISQKDIIAIQGPFTKEFDQALYKQYGITLMITKDSGKVGSVNEKLAAAKELGIETIIIKRPSIEYGILFSQFSDVISHLKLIMPNMRV